MTSPRRLRKSNGGAVRATAAALVGLIVVGAQAADQHRTHKRAATLLAGVAEANAVDDESPLAKIGGWVCGEAEAGKEPPHTVNHYLPEAADPAAPWAAKLEIVEERFKDGAMTVSNCSAAALTRGWLITAAHCVGQEGWISVRATLGAKDSGDPGAVRRNVQAAVCHEKFDPRSLAYDVALLKLDQPLPANFPLLRLASDAEIARLARGDAALSAGWGRVSKSEISRHLRKAHVEVVDPARLQDGMIVAAPTRHEDSLCIGESGAPLVADLGSGPALFGVFSSVDAYFDPSRDEMVELCHGFEARSYFTGLRRLRGWIDRVVALCSGPEGACGAHP